MARANSGWSRPRQRAAIQALISIRGVLVEGAAAQPRAVKHTMIMKKISLRTYVSLLAVFIGSFGCAYFLPINEAFKGIATTPAIGALLVAIY